MFEMTDSGRRADFFRDLEGCTALLLSGCSFTDGAEGEHQISFYLWGEEVIRSHYNSRTTATRLYTICGDDKRRLLDLARETDAAIVAQCLA